MPTGSIYMDHLVQAKFSPNDSQALILFSNS